MGAPTVTFDAKAILSVSVHPGHDYDMELLKRQIAEADAENPWVVYFDGSKQPSMMDIDEITTSDLGREKRYEAEVWPYLPITLQQIHAYNRYANQLAANLAKKLNGEDGVVFVAVTIELESRETHYEPSHS